MEKSSHKDTLSGRVRPRAQISCPHRELEWICGIEYGGRNIANRVRFSRVGSCIQIIYPVNGEPNKILFYTCCYKYLNLQNFFTVFTKQSFKYEICPFCKPNHERPPEKQYRVLNDHAYVHHAFNDYKTKPLVSGEIAPCYDCSGGCFCSKPVTLSHDDITVMNRTVFNLSDFVLHMKLIPENLKFANYISTVIERRWCFKCFRDRNFKSACCIERFEAEKIIRASLPVGPVFSQTKPKPSGKGVPTLGCQPEREKIRLDHGSHHSVLEQIKSILATKSTMVANMRNFLNTTTQTRKYILLKFFSILNSKHIWKTLNSGRAWRSLTYYLLKIRCEFMLEYETQSIHRTGTVVGRACAFKIFHILYKTTKEKSVLHSYFSKEVIDYMIEKPVDTGACHLCRIIRLTKNRAFGPRLTEVTEHHKQRCLKFTQRGG